MDQVKAMRVFSAVVKKGGFSRAADELNIATSAVSRMVNDLEAWLGVKLLVRTTRKLSLTEAGESYLGRINQILNEVDDLQQAARDSGQIPSGTIKLTAPVFLGKYFLEPLLAEFMERFPDIRFQFLLVDRFVDLVEEGYDMAIRIAHLPDSNLIARRLGEFKVRMTASPGYLEKYGNPQNLEELAEHYCLVDTTPGHADRWPLAQEDGLHNFRVKSSVMANNGEMIRSMTCDGLGISYLPEFLVRQDLSEGRLVEVLPSLTSHNRVPVSLVYTHNRYLSGAVTAMVEYLMEKRQTLTGGDND